MYDFPESPAVYLMFQRTSINCPCQFYLLLTTVTVKDVFQRAESDLTS